MGFEIVSLQGVIIYLAYFVAGIVDSICGGGGLITIPAMMTVGIPVHYITGTNQCAAWIGSGVGGYQFIKQKKVNMFSAIVTLPCAIVGSYLGASLNLLIPENYLKIFMLVMIPVIAVFMFINKDLGKDNEIENYSKKQIILRAAFIGLLVGGYQGFYGPGAGMFSALAFAFFLKLDLVRATGNTRFVLAVSSMASVYRYALSSTVIWPLAIMATLFNIIGSYIGAKLAIKNGSKLIRPIMFVVVFMLLIKLIIDML